VDDPESRPALEPSNIASISVRMNDFQQTAAVSIPIRIGGREFRFRPLRYCDHAEAARRMQQHWRHPREVVRRIGKGLPRALQHRLIELAYREERCGREPTLAEVFRWYDTPEGALFRRWLMLRREHPELTLEDVDELLTEATLGEAEALENAAGEADGLSPGNPTSPPLRKAEASEPVGNKSFGDSPSATAGRGEKSHR